MENSKEPIRILNIVPNMRAAGIESFIMNVYRNIDRNKVQFDFIVHNKERNFFDDEIEKMGGRIYRLSLKDDKNIIKYIIDLNNFFKKHNEYKIIHGHMQSMMPLYLFIAKINNIPIRIAHSHNGSYEKTVKGIILHIFSRLSKVFSTINWACSIKAGTYLFGKKEFEVIYNGIDTTKFRVDYEARRKKRQELEMENKFVILHIGRFELQKNHVFLIKIFKKYLEVNKDALLLLLGEGKLENKIKELVKKNNIKESVKFLGIRNDVNEIMNSADCFVLPSLYEGLPVVGVEAQMAGLSCVFSNTITKELNISNDSYFEDIKDVNLWINRIHQLENKEKHIILEDKFNIDNISKKIQERYIEYEKKSEK